MMETTRLESRYEEEQDTTVTAVVDAERGGNIGSRAESHVLLDALSCMQIANDDEHSDEHNAQ